MSILSNFKRLDFLSQEFDFELNESPKYKTNQGAFFSLIIFITALVLTILFGREVYLREKPLVSKSQEFVDKSIIYLDEFPFLISLWNVTNGYPIVDFLDYIDIQLMYFTTHSNATVNIDTNLFLKSCGEVAFAKHQDKVEQYRNQTKGVEYYCLDTNLKNRALLKNDGDSIDSAFLAISFFTCNVNYKTTKESKEKCAQVNEFLRDPPVLSFVFLNSYINSARYDEPVISFFDVFNTRLSNNISKVARMYFTLDIYISDDGWILDDQRNINYYNNEYTVMDYNLPESSISLMNSKRILDIQLSGKKIRNKYMRSYMKIQELFARVGGVANAAFLIIQVLTYHYFRFLKLAYIHTILENENSESRKDQNNFNNQFSKKFKSNSPNSEVKIGDTNKKYNDDKIIKENEVLNNKFENDNISKFLIMDNDRNNKISRNNDLMDYEQESIKNKFDIIALDKSDNKIFDQIEESRNQRSRNENNNSNVLNLKDSKNISTPIKERMDDIKIKSNSNNEYNINFKVIKTKNDKNDKKDMNNNKIPKNDFPNKDEASFSRQKELDVSNSRFSRLNNQNQNLSIFPNIIKNDKLKIEGIKIPYQNAPKVKQEFSIIFESNKNSCPSKLHFSTFVFTRICCCCKQKFKNCDEEIIRVKTFLDVQMFYKFILHSYRQAFVSISS